MNTVIFGARLAWLMTYRHRGYMDRTYARGYQLTGFTASATGGVTVTANGSYLYDTNNNMVIDPEFKAFKGSDYYAYRGDWTFTFDRKNRMKSFKHTSTDTVRFLWWSPSGQVWQSRSPASRPPCSTSPPESVRSVAGNQTWKNRGQARISPPA